MGRNARRRRAAKGREGRLRLVVPAPEPAPEPAAAERALPNEAALAAGVQAATERMAGLDRYAQSALTVACEAQRQAVETAVRMERFVYRNVCGDSEWRCRETGARVRRIVHGGWLAEIERRGAETVRGVGPTREAAVEHACRQLALREDLCETQARRDAVMRPST